VSATTALAVVYHGTGVAGLLLEVRLVGGHSRPCRIESGGSERSIAMPTAGDARWRILVIANETAASAAVAEEVRWRARGRNAEVLVVAPLTPPLVSERSSDSAPEDRLAEAKVRLEAVLAALADAGLNARGELGDADPLRALDHVVGRFHPDELIIATHPPDRSRWLTWNVVQRARERFQLPTTHVVADVGSERWESEGGAVRAPDTSNDPPAEA